MPRSKITTPIALADGEKKTVLCQGCFDVLHLGHIKHLQAAKSLAPTCALVVGVTADRFVNKGPGRPMFSQEQRMEALAVLECVDWVIPSNHISAVPLIESVKPYMYVKGSEYRDKKDGTGKIGLERAAVERHGGELVFTDEITFSSTKIMNKMLAPSLELDKIVAAIDQDIDELIDSAADTKVLVVGETIFDQYKTVKITGTTKKHGCIACDVLNTDEHSGGVIATARHAAALSKYVDVLTCVSDVARVEQGKIQTVWGEPIPYDIEKVRFVDQDGGHVFRATYLTPDWMYEDVRKSFEDTLCAIVGAYDLIIVNDFGHGLITKKVKYLLEEVADRTTLALNAQTNNSNFPYNSVFHYAAADYVSMNEIEAAVALQEKSTIEAAAIRVAAHFGALASVTAGKDGVYLADTERCIHIPGLAPDIVDGTGAGDAYLAVSALMDKTPAPMEAAGLVGSAAATLAAQIPGNKAPITKQNLKRYLRTLLNR